MPDPIKLIRTIQLAVQAFRSTPGRQGRFLELQDVAEVLVAGDLHGNVENFRLLLRLADLGNRPQRHLVLQELIHGPNRYPAGGDKSHQLVDLLAALKCQYPRQVHYLLGNHELAQATNQQIGKGDENYNAIFREGVATAYGPHAAAVYAAYLDLFAAAPLVLRTPNRVLLSHSLPGLRRLEDFDPTVLKSDQTDPQHLRLGGGIHALLWGRDTRSGTAAAFLHRLDSDLLITGHIPCPNGFDTPNERQLILDCMGTPACYCLFPTDRPLTLQELLSGVGTL